MNKNVNLVGGALLGALALLGTAALPASAADSGDTVTTFSLVGGSLDVTVAGNRALSNGAPGTTSVSGSLGNVAVTDTRGSVVGWVASAGSTDFTSGTTNVTTSTAVAYDSGTVTPTSGVVTTTTTGSTVISEGAAPVAAGTLALGNHSASWVPTLTVALPTTSLAGDYSGTVTTSVA